MKDRKSFFSGTNTIVAAAVCVFIGLAFGFLILVGLSWSALVSKGEPFTFSQVIAQAYDSGFSKILLAPFSMAKPTRLLRSEIALAAPLIMCGLSVGFAFKTGLFNIGAAGQYTVGAYGGLLFALVVKAPWWVCLIAAALFGAIWGAIPGFFKAYFNINEVITAIMFNWIGLYGVNTLVYGNGTGAMYCAKTTKTWTIKSVNASGIIPDTGIDFLKNPATIAIFIAIAVAIVLYIVLNKTVFGYELKACGYSKTAAQYAGINEKKNIILSMTIAGALAGLGAGLYYLTDVLQWQPLVSTALPGMGFDGISVALLASSNPIGTIFSAFLIAHISTGGGLMSANLFPPEIASIISGVIIYLCAFMMLFRTKLAKLYEEKPVGCAFIALFVIMVLSMCIFDAATVNMIVLVTLFVVAFLALFGRQLGYAIGAFLKNLFIVVLLPLIQGLAKLLGLTAKNIWGFSKSPLKNGTEVKKDEEGGEK